MGFKCPDCGATLTDDSKFCKYCGAKIDDGVKRVEVNINKRIEDVAEIKRAGYEEKESSARIRKMEREHKAGRAKRIALLTILVLCVLSVFPALVFGCEGPVWGIAAGVGIPIGALTGCGILYQLITGKW